MTDKELAIKYTETMYATKAEVAKDLKTSLVDPIWENINKYRLGLRKVLSLFAISKSPYFFTMTSQLRDSLARIQNDLTQLAIKVSKMPNDAPERVTVRSEMYGRILKAVALANGVRPSDVTIANIITERPVSDENARLINYFASLKYLEKNFLLPVSQDALGEYLTTMQGVEELTSFYRIKEIQTREQKALVGRQYTSAPVSLIEPLLDNAIDFINGSSLDYVVKAFAAYYSLNSIKPFDDYNEELSVIIAKKILAPQSIEGLVSLIPLEEVLNERPELLARGFNEAAKTRDLTYLLLEFLSRLERAISIFSTRLEQIQLTKIKTEFYQGDDEEAFAKEIGKTYIKETPVVEKKKEEPIRRLSNNLQPKPVRQQYEPTTVVHVAPVQHVASKDYDALAEDLLESDPFLKPGQAAFYVRHCTVGKFYTIAQYQKATGCVYETARTSMDNLAKRGYYKRENLKNKFIYTPIPKE